MSLENELLKIKKEGKPQGEGSQAGKFRKILYGYPTQFYKNSRNIMQFKAKIIKFGNSKGVVIPAKLLKEAKKELGDVITLEIVGGEIKNKRVVSVDSVFAKNVTLNRESETFLKNSAKV